MNRDAKDIITVLGAGLLVFILGMMLFILYIAPESQRRCTDRYGSDYRFITKGNSFCENIKTGELRNL